jgi:hypothetical protein
MLEAGWHGAQFPVAAVDERRVDTFASTVLLLAWGYGIVTVGWSIRRWPERRAAGPIAARALGATALMLVLGSLTLPWVAGHDVGDGARLVLSGWTGLDPLTIAAVLGLSIPTAAYLVRPGAGGTARQPVRAAQAVCLVGLLGGNALIQASAGTATALDVGGIVGTVGALLLLVSVAPDRPAVTSDGPVRSDAAAPPQAPRPESGSGPAGIRR